MARFAQLNRPRTDDRSQPAFEGVPKGGDIRSPIEAPHQRREPFSKAVSPIAPPGRVRALF
jgi:hypothetical protein